VKQNVIRHLTDRFRYNHHKRKLQHSMAINLPQSAMMPEPAHQMPLK
jgi:hypothetical protein